MPTTYQPAVAARSGLQNKNKLLNQHSQPLTRDEIWAAWINSRHGTERSIQLLAAWRAGAGVEEAETGDDE